MHRWQILALVLALMAVAVAVGGLAQGAEPDRIKAVLWVGGVAHDFDSFARTLTDLLPRSLPVDLEVVRDGGFLDRPAANKLDVIVMNHCFQSVEGVLDERQQRELLDLVRGGVGVVAIHASYYSFVAWDAIREFYGARFTQHGNSDVQVQVRLVDRSHPVARGLPETFRVHTELYQSTPLAEDCHLLARAREEGTEQEYPSVWTRSYGKGRVVTILPGHWPDAYKVPEFRKLIANSTLWAARGHRLATAQEAR